MHRQTLEYDELGIEPPVGFQPQRISTFPTPGQAIENITDPGRRRMLERLYPEYQELCAYAHGRPVAGFGKLIFDDRSPARGMYSQTTIETMYEQQILTHTQLISLLAVAQSTAELTLLYPKNIELAKTAMDAWNDLYNTDVMVNSVWHLRTKAMFGIIGG